MCDKSIDDSPNDINFLVHGNASWNQRPVVFKNCQFSDDEETVIFACIGKLMINLNDRIVLLSVLNCLIPPYIPIGIIVLLFVVVLSVQIVKHTLICKFLLECCNNWQGCMLQRLRIGSIIFLVVLESTYSFKWLGVVHLFLWMIVWYLALGLVILLIHYHQFVMVIILSVKSGWSLKFRIVDLHFSLFLLHYLNFIVLNLRRI